MAGRSRKLQVLSADQVLNEYAVDRDAKKVTNAVTILERRFYDSLYPEYNPKDTLNDKFQRLVVAADALKQKEKLDLFMLNKDILDG